MTPMEALSILESKKEPIIVAVDSGDVEYGMLLSDWGQGILPENIKLRIVAKATRKDWQHMVSVLNLPDPSTGSPQEKYYRARTVKL